MSQWAGNGLISYYLSIILDSIGIKDSFHKTLINGILQIFNWFSAIFGALLVDRMGRRPLWLWSVTGMFVSYIIWTACSAVYAHSASKASAIAVLALIFVYQFHYAIAMTPFTFSMYKTLEFQQSHTYVTFTGYPVEILPFQNRQKGMAIAYVGNSLANMFNSLVSPIAMDAIGWKYYTVYIVLLAQFLVVVYFFFPETKGHSLEQIADIFEGNIMTGRVKKSRDLEVSDEKSDMVKEHIECISAEGK